MVTTIIYSFLSCLQVCYSPSGLHATISPNWVFQHLLTVFVLSCTGLNCTHTHTHTLPLLSSVQSLCPVWERWRRRFLKSWTFVSSLFIKVTLSLLILIEIPLSNFPFPEHNLFRATLNTPIHALFEVSELTWKHSCFGLLCKGWALYISDMQSVKTLMGMASWRDPKQEPKSIDTKQIQYPHLLLLGHPNKPKIAPNPWTLALIICAVHIPSEL